MRYLFVLPDFLMDILHLQSRQVALNPGHTGPDGFLWLDATHDEVMADPEGWRSRVAGVSGLHLYDLHLTDATNLSHP